MFLLLAVIVDADESCNVARFTTSGPFTRTWNIKATQYKCGDTMAGPSGCLQYFTTTTGRVSR